MILQESSEHEILMEHSFTQTITDDNDSTFRVTGLQNSPFKILLTVILVLLSGGSLLLFMHWYPNVNVVLTKKRSRLKDATFVHVVSTVSETQAISPIVTADGGRFFIFQYLKYTWSSSEFAAVKGLENLYYSDIHAMSAGLVDDVLSFKFAKYGLNIINVPIPSYLKLFFKEIIQPFYIFQIAAVALWMWDDYRLYASAIIVISLVSIGITIVEERSQNTKIHEMAASSIEVTVLRGGEMRRLPSCELLPGDALLIPREGLLLCCDAVLVSGSTIVNECALTGESVPVTKAPIPYISKFVYEGQEMSKTFEVSDDKVYDSTADRKYSLYSGTTVIQSKPSSGKHSVAIVIRTGFNTFKGSLIRSILCPKPIKFDFETDAKRFITMLSCFAVCGFCYTAYISLKFGGSIGKTLRLGLDLVTVVVPPALPAALTIGVVYAVQRLKRANIFCIEPQRVNFCGKIQYICFDKTGTLTEDGLTVTCALPSAGKRFDAPVNQGGDLGSHRRLQCALASCHEIGTIHGELVGDPLDVEMFRFTGWQLEEASEFVVGVVRPAPLPGPDVILSNPELVEEDEPELGILRAFPFTSDLQRMSVVCKDLSETAEGEELVVFCKGSPEMIASLCAPASIPVDFEETLLFYTKEGFRVIAFGWKSLDLPWHGVQTMARASAESDLQFLGLLVMENHLKEDTSRCIAELTESNTQVCMVTGDNILTAISVGRKCGIVPAGDHDVVLMKQAGDSVSLQLDFREDTAVVLPEEYSPSDIVSALRQLSSRQHVFAVSEAAFAHVSSGSHPLLYDLLLTRGKIFARMKPAQKQQLVEDLQKIGYIVSMCGDGANDCGALKASHAGVSLSEAEASIAAPFTSTTPSISCMREVLRQGRAALVTASVTFRFMAMYSMIQFISVLLHYSFGSNLTDSQFLYVDLFVISGIAVTLGRSHPAPALAPTTPASQLVDLRVFVLLVCHVILTFLVQFCLLSYLRARPFFVPFTPNDDLKEGACFENTALFTVSGFQYAAYGLVLMQGPPHRMPVYRNWLFLAAFLACTVFTGLFIFQPIPWLTHLMNLVSLRELPVQITFVLGVSLNLVLAILIEMIFGRKNITRFLEEVRFFSRPKARYIQIAEQWGTVYSDFTSKNFYK